MIKRIFAKLYYGTFAVYHCAFAMTLGATICKLAFFSQYKSGMHPVRTGLRNKI